jgi:alkyl hydroperoxide reductase subunit AhpF
VLVDKLKSLPNVTIHVNAQTTEVVGDGQKVNGLKWKDRPPAQEHSPAAGRCVRADRPGAQHRVPARARWN